MATAMNAIQNRVQERKHPLNTLKIWNKITLINIDIKRVKATGKNKTGSKQMSANLPSDINYGRVSKGTILQI